MDGGGEEEDDDACCSMEVGSLMLSSVIFRYLVTNEKKKSFCKTRICLH